MTSALEETNTQRYWFVGSTYGRVDDQTPRFLQDGIWENGYADRYLDVVKSIQPGDRIAIKSSYTRKHDLPFDNHGFTVSVMAIKATGTVTENLGDGRTVKVNWEKQEKTREWYFYTHRGTIWRLASGDWAADALRNFAFNGKDQDLGLFRNHPYWRERFGDRPVDQQRFKWTRFYEAFAEKLLAFRNRREELVAGIHKIASKVEGLSILQDHFADGTKGPLRDICPFTTMGFFNRGIKGSNRKAIAGELANLLGVTEPVPETFEGIPILNNQRSWFFSYEDTRKKDDIDVLWDVFAAALAFAETETPETKDSLRAAFDEATQRHGVGWNLTIGLYWIKPWDFLTLDSQSQAYITKTLNIPIETHGAKNRCSADDYLSLMDNLEARFKEETYPVHSFPELSLEAWRRNTKEDSPKTDFPEDQPDEEADDAIPEDKDPKDLIPSFEALMIPFLRIIQDGEEHLSNDVYRTLKSDLGMEKYDEIVLPSTQKPLFENRAAWTKTYLKKAELVEFPRKGYVRLTPRGQEIINQPPSILSQYRRFMDFFYRQERPSQPSIPCTPYGIDDILKDGCFLERAKLEKALERLRSKKNLILQGPPGTGKTWLAKRLAYALVEQRNESRVRPVQFHPNLSYEDFVRGWRPAGSGKLELIDGPFLEMITLAAKSPLEKVVVVIEEINRGNPAQIFGEMLTLLEADKRTPSEALELSYRRAPDERVFIPDNLYVIGTMNIADRSLALVDYALRRRFAFIDLEPTLGKPWRDWVSSKWGIDGDILAEIESRIQQLNDGIADDPSLGPQYRLGHSYVTPSVGSRIDDPKEWFRQVVITEIGPLLDEYWFDDAKKSRKAQDRLCDGF